MNDESYFMTSSPDFWTDNLPWPSIGYPNELGESSVPSKDRYLSEIVPVFCPGDTNLTYQTEYQEDIFRMKVFPNPTNGNFTIYFQTEVKQVEVRLITLTGQCVGMFLAESANSGTGFSVELTDYTHPGMYFLEARTASGSNTIQRIVLY